MGYNIVLEARAEKQLERLLKVDRSLALDILATLDGLKEDPRPLECRKLRGKSKGYRVKVKNYRILYRVDDGEVVITVFKIGHRREVYRGL